MLITATSTALTMNSREIAEICDARHNDVVETIERLFAKGVLRESRNTPRPHQPAGGGRPTMIFELTKRDSLVVVSGYNDELRARIIDRWIELEAAAAPAVPTSLSGALRLAAEQAEIIERQHAELVSAAPAVEFVGRYVDSTGLKGFRQVCKLIGANENTFRAFLTKQEIMYRLGGEWMPYAQHIKAGRFIVKAGTADASGHAFNSAKFTPRGVQWIAGEFAKYLVAEKQAAR